MNGDLTAQLLPQLTNFVVGGFGVALLGGFVVAAVRLGLAPLTGSRG